MNGSTSIRFYRFWREDGVFLSLLIGLFSLRFAPAFAHGALYAPFRDNVWLYGSLFSRASEIALSGQFPYWLDTVLGGFPLYQTPHFSATYPFYFFGWLDYGKAIQVLYTLSYLTCFHSLILYLNLYIMIRVAGAKGVASFCGATVGLVSGNTEIYAHWITIAAAWSWFPLLVAGMIRLLRAPLAFGSIALFSVAAALICTASPAQPVIQSAFVSAMFFGAATVWRWRRSGPGMAGRLLLGLTISALIVFALAAVAFLPMYLATGDMVRAVGNHSSVIGHASIPWESFNASQLEPRYLPHLLFDSSNLRVLGGLYVGPLALLGLLLCFLAYRQGDDVSQFLLPTFALMALYFLIAGFGTHFGLAYVHFHIPLLNRMREAARNFVVFTTLAALLAGIGFQVMMDVAGGKLELRGYWRRYYWGATLLGLFVFVVALVIDRQAKITGWIVLALLLPALLLLPGTSLRQRIPGCALILLACLASVISPPGTLPFYVSEYLYADNLTSHRVLQRVAQLPDISSYRVVIVDSAFRPMTWANNASFYGIKTFYLMFTPLPIAQKREMFDERIDFRKLRGARYFIYGQDAQPLDPMARLLFTESGYRVYEVSDAMKPYTLVHSIEAFPNKTSFDSTLARGFDYQHIAGVQRSRGDEWPMLLQVIQRRGNADPTPNELEPIVQTANVVGIATDSKRPGLLILNERWSNDWQARIDSHPAQVFCANFTQPAVALPAGRHYVEFEYKPMLFWYLLILQRTSVALLLLFALRKICVGFGGASVVPNPTS